MSHCLAIAALWNQCWSPHRRLNLRMPSKSWVIWIISYVKLCQVQHYFMPACCPHVGYFGIHWRDFIFSEQFLSLEFRHNIIEGEVIQLEDWKRGTAMLVEKIEVVIYSSILDCMCHVETKISCHWYERQTIYKTKKSSFVVYPTSSYSSMVIGKYI